MTNWNKQLEINNNFNAVNEICYPITANSILCNFGTKAQARTISHSEMSSLHSASALFPRTPTTRWARLTAGTREEKNQREWLHKSSVRRASPRIDVVKAPDRCPGSTVFGMSVRRILVGYTRCPIPAAATVIDFPADLEPMSVERKFRERERER